MADIYVQFYSP